MRGATRLTALSQPLRWLFIAMLGAAIVGPSVAWPTFRRAYLFRILFVVFWPLLLGWTLSRRERFRTVLESVTPIVTYVVFFAIWIVWMMASLLWAVDKLAGVRYVIFLLMMSSLTLGTPSMVRDAGDLKKVLAVLMLVFAAAIAVGWLEILTDFRMPNSVLIGLPARFQWASTSFFGGQNGFATYIVLWNPLLLVALSDLWPTSRRTQALIIVAIFLSSMCMVYTGSRAGLIALGLSIVMLLFLLRPKRFFLRPPLVFGIVAMFLPWVIQPQVTFRYFRLDRLAVDMIGGATGSIGLGSIARRLQLVDCGLRALWGSKLLGVGAGNAAYYVRQLPNIGGIHSLHLWWLEVLVEGGVLIGALYALFYASLLYRLFQAARRSSDTFIGYTAAGLFISLCAYIVGTLGVGSAIHYTPMWVHLGLALAVLKVHRLASEPARG